MLDVSTYVRLLHEAAMTGFLPVYNIHGRPTGTFAPVTPTQRIELMQFFINKIIPDPPREIHTTLNTPETLARSPHNVTEMTTEELLNVMNSASTAPATTAALATLEYQDV